MWWARMLVSWNPSGVSVLRDGWRHQKRWIFGNVTNGGGGGGAFAIQKLTLQILDHPFWYRHPYQLKNWIAKNCLWSHYSILIKKSDDHSLDHHDDTISRKSALHGIPERVQNKVSASIFIHLLLRIQHETLYYAVSAHVVSWKKLCPNVVANVVCDIIFSV